MRVEPYRLIRKLGNTITVINSSRRDIIYPNNSLNKQFLHDAVIMPLERSNAVSIDCGSSRKGGDFVADELKQVIEENFNCEVSKPEKRLVWDKLLKIVPYPSFHTFLSITSKYGSDFQPQPVIEESTELPLFEYNSSAAVSNDYFTDVDETFLPDYLLEEKEKDNIDVKVIKHFNAKSGSLFFQDLIDIEVRLNDSKFSKMEIIGVDYSGVAYSDGIFLKRTSISDIVLSMNGVDVVSDENQRETYEKILVNLIEYFLGKRFTVTVNWGLSREELEGKLDLPPFNNIKCELFYSDANNESPEIRTKSVFTP